jgi:hypothetical protein
VSAYFVEVAIKFSCLKREGFSCEWEIRDVQLLLLFALFVFVRVDFSRDLAVIDLCFNVLPFSWGVFWGVNGREKNYLV